MSDAFTSAGTVVSVVNELPTTFDDDATGGYPSLTYVDIGELTEVPEFGREYTLVTHNPISDRQTVKRKGSFNDGSVTMQMARVPSDAGQTILVDGVDLDDSHSFKVVLQDGTAQYFTAQIMSYTTNIGNVDSITAATVMIEIDREIVEVAPTP